MLQLADMRTGFPEKKKKKKKKKLLPSPCWFGGKPLAWLPLPPLGHSKEGTQEKGQVLQRQGGDCGLKEIITYKKISGKTHTKGNGSQVLWAETDLLARKLSQLHRAPRAGARSEASGRHGTQCRGECECAHVCVHVQTPTSQLCLQ